MFWRCATILCVLAYGALPYCVVMRSARMSPARVARAAEKKPACPGKCAGKARCSRAFKVEQPRDARDDQRCGSCRCCVPKQPASPPAPPTEWRPAPAKAAPLFDAVHADAETAIETAAALALGHDPPGVLRSNNDRLAQTAVWLK